MMKSFSVAVATILLIISSPAVSAELQSGDMLTYLNKSNNKSSSMRFVSLAEQVSSGKKIIRNAAGNRIESYGWKYTPHDGEFPEAGNLAVGHQWKNTIKTKKISGGKTYTHVRECQVEERDLQEREYAGIKFVDSFMVACRWNVPNFDVYQTTKTWYWADGQGFNLVLERLRENKKRGKSHLILEKVKSHTLIAID